MRSPKIPDFRGKEEQRSVQAVTYLGRRHSGARDDALAPAKIDKPKIAEILSFSAGSDIYRHPNGLFYQLSLQGKTKAMAVLLTYYD